MIKLAVVCLLLLLIVENSGKMNYLLHIGLCRATASWKVDLRDFLSRSLVGVQAHLSHLMLQGPHAFPRRASFPLEETKNDALLVGLTLILREEGARAELTLF